MKNINTTSRKELSEIFKFIKDVPFATVTIHSSLIPFGIVEGGIVGFWDELQSAIGVDKTIIMPAFTFTYGKTRYWDSNLTRSETGALTEYFRKNIASVRTIHPIHSVCVSGSDEIRYKQRCSVTSFGVGSAWEQLCNDEDVWNISLGIGFIGGATFCHYPEEKLQVPYREYVELPGIILDENAKEVKTTFGFYGRKTVGEHTAINYWERVMEDLTSDGYLRTWDVGNNIPITLMHVKSTADYLGNKISQNPYYLGGFDSVSNK